ncbi:MAG: esterase-like activity of phytase family protein [Rhodospirillaceae bacterium]|nr:esterase-like activity of phytase family protein [Rhodospirillales bacterium]
MPAMLPARIVALLLALTGCLGPASAGDITAVPRTLAADAGPRPMLGETEVLGILELRSSDHRFGGLSGLSFDGNRLIAITDKGNWLSFRLDVDHDGRPTGVGQLEIGALGGLDDGKLDSDSEELTKTPEGWLVSFERRHRVMLYAHGLTGKPVRLSMPQDYSRQPGNGGGEAVARLNDGRLLLLSEEGDNNDGTGWAWVGKSGAWERLSTRREGLFHPTGAATLPNGDVLVTERRFTWIGGVALRLVRMNAASVRPGAVLSGHELFRLEPPLTVDNYEGIALRQRADGRVVAYIISDDNFNPFQATLLMAVLLPD